MHDGSITPQPPRHDVEGGTSPPARREHSGFPHPITAVPTQLSADAAVRVEILGIALFVPETKNVVFVDGTKATPSFTKPGWIIPAHYTFIAFEPGKYQVPRKFKAGLSFDYDLAGDGVDETYDAFVLAGHRITIENVDTSRGQKLELDSLARVSQLVPGLELKEGVADGTRREHDVVACLELQNATVIRGEEHGLHSQKPIKFGGVPCECSEKLVAEFRYGTNAPIVRLKNKVEDVVINLIGDGPWTIMVANVPVEELMDRNTMPMGLDVPLLHNELIYKLYKTADGQQLPVPTADLPMSRTADGVCGPPYRT